MECESVNETQCQSDTDHRNSEGFELVGCPIQETPIKSLVVLYDTPPKWDGGAHEGRQQTGQ